MNQWDAMNRRLVPETNGPDGRKPAWNDTARG